MGTEVNNNYIEKALTELISVLGTKEYIDHQKLISLIQSKKTKEAIKAIALYLGSVGKFVYRQRTSGRQPRELT